MKLIKIDIIFDILSHNGKKFKLMYIGLLKHGGIPVTFFGFCLPLTK